MRSATLAVWDPGVRLFHWTLVACMAIEYILEAGTPLHIYTGYVIIGLAAFRLLWGFVGPHFARFSQFVRSPRVTLGYVRDIAAGHPRRYLGHNPAGAAMVLLLLAGVAATAISGWLWKSTSLWLTSWMGDVHEILAWGTLGLVAAHVLGVFVASFQHRENLVHSMVTGKKPAPHADDVI